MGSRATHHGAVVGEAERAAADGVMPGTSVVQLLDRELAALQRVTARRRERSPNPAAGMPVLAG